MMRKNRKNLAALGLGILLSAAALASLEGALRLNRAYGWLDLHALLSPPDESDLRQEINWEGVDRGALARIPDRYREMRAKYGDRVLTEQTEKILLPGPRRDKNYQFYKPAPDGELVYNIEYRYNEKDRRPTPGRPAKPAASIFLVGCSYTVGEGLSENETMAAYMQAGLGEAAVETLAFHGWGIGNHLSALRKERFPEEKVNPYISLEDGSVIVVYIFIPDHVSRSVCPLFCHQDRNDWMTELPNYEKDERGTIVYRGSFRESRKGRWLMKWIANSAIVTDLRLGWVFPTRSEALRDFFGMLNAYRAELGRKVRIKDFYFVPIEPYPPFDEGVSEMAKENGYNVLDLGKLSLAKMLGSSPRIPFDGHFTAGANYVLSRKILSRIKQDHPDIR